MSLYIIDDEKILKFKEIMAEQNRLDEFNEIVESQYQRLLNEINLDNTVFSYRYRDAWNHELVYLNITHDNKVFIRGRDTQNEFLTEPELIKNIFNTVKKYGDKFKLEDYFLEDDCMYDGYIYEISFSDGKDVFYCKADNLQEYDEQSPNAFIFVTMLKEIFSLLKQAGIEHEIFRFQ